MSKSKSEKKTAGGPREVSVAGRLTIRGVHELRDVLLKELQKDGDFVLTFAENEEMDVAGLQLLLAARGTVSKSSGHVELPGVIPESVRAWLDRAGVAIDAGK